MVIIEQNQRAFQRQKAISSGRARVLAKQGKDGQLRYYKKIGLGIQTPSAAIKGHYVDKKCPFTSNVNIRGRILRGVVQSHKMRRTIIVRRSYLKYNTKYQRYEKRHKNIPTHCSPCFDIKVGDEILIGECRPLSKTIRFNVIKLIGKAARRLTNKQFE